MNKEIGALISLQPNASKIVIKLGLDKYLLAKGMEDEAFRIYDMNGKKQMDIPTDLKKYGAGRILYHRADLHDSLKQAATSADERGRVVQIITSSRVVDVDCEKGLVKLESGQTFQGDLVIGADGIHSAVRKALFGERVSEPKPTGLSAYRLLLETATLEKCAAFTSVINPRQPVTTMVLGHDRRIIMGPGRDGDLYGVVALVPDEFMHEKSSTQSWTSAGSKEKLLESFSEFPSWIKELLNVSQEAPGLWQLRDIDPLDNWVRGRTILIGDAAHAMLPTQGQGASQSFEDAEALKAFLANLPLTYSLEQLSKCLQEVFETRHARASLIQTYSRQQARPATEKGSVRIKLNPTEFLDYNCRYEGAKAWKQAQVV
jgi:salicylate hydroxylase